MFISAQQLIIGIVENKKDLHMNAEALALYNSLLNDTKLMPLSLFKSNKFSKYNLFPHAQILPQFFQNNLQSDGRVVKYLKDPQGVYRGFYYQLFKLGFQIENKNADYASIIKNVIFNPNLLSSSTSPISGKQYNIAQYQRIIAQFVRILELQVIPNAELTFSQYPIIDQAMITILTLILEKVKGTRIKVQQFDQILNGLCKIFQISLEVYDNCYSFQQSDVFLYVESPSSFYLAFLSQMAEVQSYQKTSESPQNQQFKSQISSNSCIQNKDEHSIYRDMRLSAGNKGSRTKVMNRSLRDNKPQTNLYEYGSNSLANFQNHNIDQHQCEQKSDGEKNEYNKIVTNYRNQGHKNVFDTFIYENNYGIKSTQVMPTSRIPTQNGIINNAEQQESQCEQYGDHRGQQTSQNKKSSNQDNVVVSQQNKDQINRMQETKQQSTSFKIIQGSTNQGILNVFESSQAIQGSKNQGLMNVLQNIQTLKSITDGMGQVNDTKPRREVDVLSKFGYNKISESQEYSEKSRLSKQVGSDANHKQFKQGQNIQLGGRWAMPLARQASQRELFSHIKNIESQQQIQINRTLPKYQFKSHKYQFMNTINHNHSDYNINNHSRNETDANKKMGIFASYKEEWKQQLMEDGQKIHKQLNSQKYLYIQPEHRPKQTYSSNAGDLHNLHQYDKQKYDSKYNPSNKVDEHRISNQHECNPSHTQMNSYKQAGEPAPFQAYTPTSTANRYQLNTHNQYSTDKFASIHYNHNYLDHNLTKYTSSHTNTLVSQHAGSTILQGKIKMDIDMHIDVIEYSPTHKALVDSAKQIQITPSVNGILIPTTSSRQTEQPLYNPVAPGMRAMKLSKSEKYKGDMDIKMDNGDGINVTIGINVKNPNMSRQDTLGTFYRQFSDTKVMELMDEPCKTKVRYTRNKFKGIRSKNWRGFF